jgi:hypothetical protein
MEPVQIFRLNPVVHLIIAGSFIDHSLAQRGRDVGRAFSRSVTGQFGSLSVDPDGDQNDSFAARTEISARLTKVKAFHDSAIINLILPIERLA